MNRLFCLSIVAVGCIGSAVAAYDFTPDPNEYAICNSRGSKGNSATDVSRWDWPGGETPSAMREDIKYYSAKGGYFTLAENTVTRFPGTELVFDGSGASYPNGSAEILMGGKTTGTLLMTNVIVYGNTHFSTWNGTVGNISGRMEIRSRAGMPVHFGTKSALNTTPTYMKFKELTVIGGVANPIEFHTSPSHSITNVAGSKAGYGEMQMILTDCDFSQFHGTNRVYVADPASSSLVVDRSYARTIFIPNDMTMNGTLIIDDCAVLSLENVTSELVVSNLVLKGGAKIKGLTAGKTIRVTGSLETVCDDDKRIEIDLSSFKAPASGEDVATLFTMAQSATHEGFDADDLVFSGLTGRYGTALLDDIVSADTTTEWRDGNLVVVPPSYIVMKSSVKGECATLLKNWERPVGTPLVAHDATATYLMKQRAYLQTTTEDSIIFPGARQVFVSTAADEIMVSYTKPVVFSDLHLVGYAGFKSWDSTIAGLSGRITVHTNGTTAAKAAFVNLDYSLDSRTEAGSVAYLTNLTVCGVAEANLQIRGPAGLNSCGGGQTAVVLKDSDFSEFLGGLTFSLPPGGANDYDRTTARLIVKPDDLTFGGSVLFKDSALLALNDVTTEVAFGGLTLGSNSYIRAAHPDKTIRIAKKLATVPMGDVKVEVDVSSLWGVPGKRSLDLFTCAKTADVSEFDANVLTYLRNGVSADDRVEATWVETETSRIFRVARPETGSLLIVR